VPAVRLQACHPRDRCTQKKWQELGIVPSNFAPTSSSSAVSRSTVTGPADALVVSVSLPTAPDKRAQLVDALLVRRSTAFISPTKWADNSVSSAATTQAANGVSALSCFHGWIREAPGGRQALRRVCPRHPRRPSATRRAARRHVWYKDLRRQPVRGQCDAVFLGLRLACARAIITRTEKWSPGRLLVSRVLLAGSPQAGAVAGQAIQTSATSARPSSSPPRQASPTSAPIGLP